MLGIFKIYKTKKKRTTIVTVSFLVQLRNILEAIKIETNQDPNKKEKETYNAEQGRDILSTNQ